MFYKKRKKKGRIVLFICALLLFAGFTYGYISNSRPLNKPENISKVNREDETRVKKQENNNVTEDIEGLKEKFSMVDGQDEDNIVDDVEKVNEDSEIIFNTYYVKTGEIDTEKASIPVTTVGYSLNELKDYIESNYSDWKIRSVSTKSVSLFKQIDGYKPNYFVIQSKDGNIVVFKINKEGKKQLYDETGISLSVLSETDKKKLNNGIVVKSLEEVYNIIEDYSS